MIGNILFLLIIIIFYLNGILGEPQCSGQSITKYIGGDMDDAESYRTLCHTEEQPDGGEIDLEAQPQFYGE